MDVVMNGEVIDLGGTNWLLQIETNLFILTNEKRIFSWNWMCK